MDGRTEPIGRMEPLGAVHMSMIFREVEEEKKKARLSTMRLATDVCIVMRWKTARQRYCRFHVVSVEKCRFRQF